MNKNELKEKIEKLENELAELKNSLNKPQEEYKRWRAETGGEYWTVSYETVDNIYFHNDERDSFDNFLFSIGNYFKTEEEAEKYKNNLIVKQQLKDLALRLNKGKEINWNDFSCCKYCLVFDNQHKKLVQDYNQSDKVTGQVYCLNENFLEVAKKEIGEEKLIELIKSGV